jgi:SAM-dependent methyltransferase
MPLPHVLDEYYAHYYQPGAARRVTTGDVRRMARHVLRALPQGWLGGRAELSVLDVGGGDGSIALALGQLAGIPTAVTLVDPAAGAAAAGGPVSLRHFEDLSQVDGEYDLVLASAVIEHVPEAWEFVTGLFRRVAPNGCLYARTPYVEMFFRLLKGYDLTFPGHVHDLGPAFWNGVPESFDGGLELVHSRTSVVETSWSEYPARTLLAYTLKLPSRLETWLRGFPRKVLWPFVGGWEVVLWRRPPAAARPR